VSFSEYSYAGRVILVNNAVKTPNLIYVSCLTYNLTSVGVRNPILCGVYFYFQPVTCSRASRD